RRRDRLAEISRRAAGVRGAGGDAAPAAVTDGDARIADATALRVRAALHARVFRVRERMQLRIVVDAVHAVHRRRRLADRVLIEILERLLHRARAQPALRVELEQATGEVLDR